MMTKKVFELIKLDVSCLPAPEPMTQIIQALAKLTDQQVLKVHHRREPLPLYEKLTCAGWLYNCQQLKEENFVIYIYHSTQHQFVTEITTNS